MSQFVKLQNRIMQIRELKMRRHNIGIRIICRMLHGRKIINAVLFRNDDDSARMLASRPFDADAARHKAIHIRTAKRNAALLQIF